LIACAKIGVLHASKFEAVIAVVEVGFIKSVYYSRQLQKVKSVTKIRG